MNSYLETSIICGFFRYLKQAFGTSLLNRFFSTLRQWVLQSRTYRIVIGYLERNSTAKYTLTYRLLAFFGKKLDRLVIRGHKLYREYYKSSTVHGLVDDCFTVYKKGLNLLVLTAVGTFILGYAAAVTVKGQWGRHSLIIVGAAAVLGFILSTTADKLQSAFKSSVTCKLCQYLWD